MDDDGAAGERGPHAGTIITIIVAMVIAGVAWMTAVQRENVAHMLASMHLVLRQQDGGERTAGEYGHVTNTTYEKFVEK